MDNEKVDLLLNEIKDRILMAFRSLSQHKILTRTFVSGVFANEKERIRLLAQENGKDGAVFFTSEDYDNFTMTGFFTLRVVGNREKDPLCQHVLGCLEAALLLQGLIYEVLAPYSRHLEVRGVKVYKKKAGGRYY